MTGHQDQAQARESEENDQAEDIKKIDQDESARWITERDTISVVTAQDDPMERDMEIEDPEPGLLEFQAIPSPI